MKNLSQAFESSLILDNPFQARMVAKFPNGFSLSFFFITPGFS
jgi:hypothetical protein